MSIPDLPLLNGFSVFDVLRYFRHGDYAEVMKNAGCTLPQARRYVKSARFALADRLGIDPVWPPGHVGMERKEAFKAAFWHWYSDQDLV